jgi:glycerophosphoryl diester phosphodiesterase
LKPLLFFRIGTAAIALLILGCGNFNPPYDEGNSPPQEKPRKQIELHGHRGARGLMPENTWPAFEAGIRAGMTAIELDTMLTADGELIIHHDPFTNPKLCRNDDGSKIKSIPIHHLTVTYLKRLDCGSLKNEKFPGQQIIPFSRIITLRELFSRIRELEKTETRARSIVLNIDAKFPAGKSPSNTELRKFAEILLTEIDHANLMERVIVQAFEIRLLPHIKEIAPQVRTSALFQWSKWPGVGKRTQESMIARVLAIKADILAPNMRDTDEKLVSLAHASGIAIIPWTVNEPEQMRALLRLGVDGLISDYPDRLKNVADGL